MLPATTMRIALFLPRITPPGIHENIWAFETDACCTRAPKGRD
jgi:hypothetical protein